MNKDKFLKKLKEKVFVLDGAKDKCLASLNTLILPTSVQLRCLPLPDNYDL